MESVVTGNVTAAKAGQARGGRLVTGRAVRRAAARGVTLIEILIVLAIIAMIGGGIAMVAIPKFNQARVDSTKTNMIEIHKIAEMWRSLHNECPSIERLKAEKEIAATSKTSDAWDHPYRIDCTEDDLAVISMGPDGKENTKDDLRIPEAAATPK